jgi:glutamate racemase
MKADNRNRPIGVFDSGIGGLTVLKELIKELPDESTIYLGDTARVPYGIRSADTVLRYSFENTKFLSSKDVKMIVIACNTASSVSLEAVRQRITIPVIGVIEPGAKAAAAATFSKKVAVIGTEATVRSGSYTRAILLHDPQIEVFPVACPLFVPLVEEGWTEGDIAEMIARRYLETLAGRGIDTVVLGCTHYPLMKKVLGAVMGESVRLIDSAEETSVEIRRLLDDSDMRSDVRICKREFYVTDSPERFLRVGEHFLGQKIEHMQRIILGNQ